MARRYSALSELQRGTRLPLPHGDRRKRRRRRYPSDPAQLALFGPDGTPARFGRLAPGDRIECDRMHCNLSANECANRSSRTWPGGNRRKNHGDVIPRTARVNAECNGCPVGEVVRLSLPLTWKPKRLGFGGNFSEQRRARRAWIRSRPEHQVPDLDHPPAGESGPTTEERERDALEAIVSSTHGR